MPSCTSHTYWVSAVVVTPDGLRVISGSRDKTLKLWNLETAEELFTPTGHRDLVRVIVVIPDGVTIVAGERLGRLHFLGLEGMERWDLEKLREAFEGRGRGYYQAEYLEREID